MGVDLTWLVLDGFKGGDFAYSHTILEVGGVDEAYYNKLAALPSESIPLSTWSYVSIGDNGEPRYGQIKNTPYGSPAVMVKASDLMMVEHDDALIWHRAAVAYLRELPQNTRVILWWH